jgi:two-component system OmpR family response regulator
MDSETCPRVLVVDDDPALRELLTTYLAANGLSVAAVGDGTGMRTELAAGFPDAIVLDLMLPGEDGLSLTRAVRAQSNVPILMLSARGEEIDRVIGLEVGADDYLAKPFGPRELLARLRALLRRAVGIATAEIEIGKLHIDPRASRVTYDGNPVKLTSQEYRLLAYLAHHRGKVVSRTELVEHLYDQDFDRDSNTIEVFIGRLRKKTDAGLIQTVRGLGYSLEDPKLGGKPAEV